VYASRSPVSRVPGLVLCFSRAVAVSLDPRGGVARHNYMRSTVEGPSGRKAETKNQNPVTRNQKRKIQERTAWRESEEGEGTARPSPTASVLEAYHVVPSPSTSRNLLARVLHSRRRAELHPYTETLNRTALLPYRTLAGAAYGVRPHGQRAN
jgi:hypothetical protein